MPGHPCAMAWTSALLLPGLLALGSNDSCTGPLRGSAPLILGDLAPAWAADLARVDGRPRIELARPFGPPTGALDPALEGFLEGRSDFAFLTRDIAEADLATFRNAHDGADPIVIPVAAGAWNRFGYVDAVAIIVNDANPVRRLSFRQLDAIFSTSHWRGGGAVDDWAGLGAGTWRGRAVHIVGGDAWSGQESARALTIRRRILSVAGRRGQWRAAPGTGGEAEVVDRVAADPLAIGFTGMGHLKPGVHAVAIARTDAGAAYDPTARNIIADRYPLARTVDLLVAPGGGCVRPVQGFARYLLGGRAQAIVARTGPFLALSPAARRRSLRLVAGIAVAKRTTLPHRNNGEGSWK